MTRTSLAVAVSVGTIEVLMPCLEEYGLVFARDGRDAIQFGRVESTRGLVSVAGEEEKPIRATMEDGRSHGNDSGSFPTCRQF